ncbi:MAG: NlpC/P60 family protein [Andreesenia angusta]|nr:NlpC/P60 family protein [Andreesenia angusta]
MKKKLVCSILTLSVCLGGGAALASPELEVVEQDINNVKSEISEYQAQVAEVEQVATETANQLESLNSTEAVVNEELGNLSATYSEEKAVALEKVKEVYEKENTNYEEMLLEADNMGSYFEKLEKLKQAVSTEPELLENLKAVKDGIDYKEVELESVKDEKINIENRLNVLQSEVAQTEEVKAQIAVLEEELNKLENQKQEIAMAEELKNTNSNVISIAEQYLGTPYVWGGTTPNGFDCSGFVQYVYRQAGINIPRVTTGQEYAGVDVTGQELKPGDLVFWGSRGSTHHVGMYIGDGKYIHSPQTGDVVRVATLRNYSVARRILN